jgi:hypothetical protein
MISVSDLRPNQTGLSGQDLAKGFISHQPFGFRPIEVNTNNYFLSGHPAGTIIGIQGYGRPGEPGASQGIEPHDVQMMMLLATSGGKGYNVGYLCVCLKELMITYKQHNQ